MKISTWNVNSLNVRIEHVCSWISDKQPDVLCLQETKTVDEKFPQERFRELGYFSRYAGQKTYNGVAIVARSEILKPVVTDFPAYQDPQRRLLAANIDNIRVVNVYIPNGKEVGSDKYQYKLEWLGHLLNFIKGEIQQHEHVVLTGDYNIAPTDDDVYAPEEWEGKILCSEPERSMFRSLVDTGLHDSFRKFDQPEKSYSWWDYRQAAFRRDMGMRIDHILASDAMNDKCIACDIDKEPRTWERPSDHTPVMATYDM